MTTLKHVMIAAFVLAVLFMVVTARPATPALAGFTPSPIPPGGTPQPPEKEPKVTPTPTGINLTVTPGVLPIAGGQPDEPGVRVILIVGIIVLVAAGIAASRLARSE
jgi:hypothetical protein